MSKKIEMHVQWNGGPDAFAEFCRKLQKDIAESYGIPYEQLTSKMDAANVSAGDDILAELRDSFEARRAARRFAPEPLGHWKLPTAIDHLRDRGYAYHRLTGWCTRRPLAILDLDAMDAQAILYLYYAVGLMTPRGIGWTALVDYAFGRSMNRYVMTDKGCVIGGDTRPLSAEKPEDRVAMAETANREPCIVKVTVTGRLGKSRVQMRLEEMLESEGFKVSEDEAEDHSLLVEIPDVHDENMGLPPKKAAVEPAAPQFEPGELDTLTHALGVWKRAGERIGIPIRQDYIDRILYKVSEHTDYSK